ncbi:MAG: hypothetical protein C0391_03845 [Anaerolinea sp.]|nr:hypothetical protein [Anaerolinea sp.]
MELPTTFQAFLTLLGSPIFIGVIISVLLIRWAWFVNLQTKAKFWIVGAISLGLPIISRLLIIYLPGQVVVFVETWWPTLVGGMGIWMSSQVWNKLFGADGAISKASTIKQLNDPTKK